MIKQNDTHSEYGHYFEDFPFKWPENVVRDIYNTADGTINNELKHLQQIDNILPSCLPGCSHCCRQNIMVNIAEAHALTSYIKREFSTGQIEQLRIKTKSWHQWDSKRVGRDTPKKQPADLLFSSKGAYCPLLFNGKCQAYPVRPMVCRNHYVMSNPECCRPLDDPLSPQCDPVIIMSVISATSPHSSLLRTQITSKGLDYCKSIMLLPHWLAVEMEWDFALSNS